MHPELYRRQAIDVRRKRAKRVLTHEDIDGHVSAYLSRGGQIHEFECGASGEADLLAKAIHTLRNRRNKQVRPKKYKKDEQSSVY